MRIPLEPGDELDHGKYRIVRMLGQGGMGLVYEALHTLSERRLAIKCLHPARMGDVHSTERMLREARASARVQHPNVVDVYDVCRDEQWVFLVMELLEGETLDVALARGDLALHNIVALLLPGMQAVAEAHKQGVIHRDIKPQNIFLARVPDSPTPVTKILDFGLSTRTMSPERKLTASNSALGTPMYMPYEQLADRDVDVRMDVYAFGVVLYEALTGRRPYEAATAYELIHKLLEGPPVSPKQRNGKIPTALSNLVLWTIAREPEERVQSMQQLIRELEPFSRLRGFATDDSTNVALPTFEAPTSPPTDAPQLKSIAAPTTANFLVSKRVHRRLAWSLVSTTAVVLALAIHAASSKRMGRGSLPSAPTKEVAPDAVEPRRDDDSTAGPERSKLNESVLTPAQPAAPSISPAAPAAAKPRTKELVRKPFQPAVAPQSPNAAPARDSAVLSEALARRGADIQRLREQLAQCGDLQTPWLRDQCRERSKRELAQREEEYELATPKSVR